MRAFNPGGRFDSDFEIDSLLEGANADLQSPAGSSVLWWIYDPINTVIDPVYDVGSDLGGRKYRGPYELPVIRAIIDQGSVPLDERGYYNADNLHLTINAEEIEKIVPGVIGNPDLQNRGRILWMGEVFRPMTIQQRGIVKNRFSLVVVDCIEVMNDELINDPDFQKWAGPFDRPVPPARSSNPSIGTIDPSYPIIEPSPNG